MQPPRPRPLTTEQSLRRMYVEGRIEVEEFEYAIDKLLRAPYAARDAARAAKDWFDGRGVGSNR